MFFLLPFWDSDDMNVRCFVVVIQFFKSLFIFPFYFCCSDWVILFFYFSLIFFFLPASILFLSSSRDIFYFGKIFSPRISAQYFLKSCIFAVVINCFSFVSSMFIIALFIKAFLLWLLLESSGILISWC